MKKFRILPHTADLKIQAFGQSLPELFSSLAEGMFTSVTEKLGQEKGIINFTLDSAPDNETLLVSFLNEVWILGFEQGKALKEFEFEEFSLDGIKGKAKKVEVLGWKAEIKAATFHELKIKKTKEGFETTVVFDI